MRLRYVIALVAALAALTGGCRHSEPSGQSVATRLVSGFKDDLNVAAAGSKNSAALAVLGRDEEKRPPEVRVFHRPGDGGWSRVPSPPVVPDAGETLFLAFEDDDPCLATTVSRQRRVVCLESSRWHDRSFPDGIRNGNVVDLTARKGRLYLLGSAAADGSVQVFRRFQDSWHAIGPAIPLSEGVAKFVQSSPRQPGPPEVGLVQFNRPGVPRSILRYNGAAWRRSLRVLKGRDDGPTIMGPVRIGRRVYWPIVRDNAKPWSFSIFASRGSRWVEVGGRPLSRGEGNAQGVATFAQGKVWATWQENAFRPDGLFATSIVTIPIDSRTLRLGQRRRLWRGPSIGPGDLGTFETRTGPFAYFLRAHAQTPTTALQLEVKPIRP